MDMDADADADADSDSESDILESLLKEFICPLCGEYFKDPMITSCGHDFCRACIIRHWERCRDSFPCPVCGAERPEIRLRPNRQLRNAAEPAQSLAAEARRSQVEPPEPWARAGRADRAAQHLCTREEFFFGWSCERETCLEPLPFGFPQPCLIEGPPSVCVICRGLLQHGSNIFLPIQNAAQQYQPFCRPHKKHPDALKASLRPANVTLDPATAHPDLVLSEDGKRVRRAGTRQPRPDTPERFDPMRCVLGSEGFTSGRHYWEVEVEVGDEQYWGVGVARESVSRKGGISLSPKGGIWAVRWWGGQFQALTDPETPLPLRPPSRIRVCLDCDQQQVTFIDAGTKAPIFTFPPGSLPRERIRPWIWVEWGTDTELRLSPLQQPLWPHTPQSV